MCVHRERSSQSGPQFSRNQSEKWFSFISASFMKEFNWTHGMRQDMVLLFFCTFSLQLLICPDYVDSDPWLMGSLLLCFPGWYQEKRVTTFLPLGLVYVVMKENIHNREWGWRVGIGSNQWPEIIFAHSWNEAQKSNLIASLQLAQVKKNDFDM